MHVIVACAESDGNNCFHLLLLMGSLFQLFFFCPYLTSTYLLFSFSSGGNKCEILLEIHKMFDSKEVLSFSFLFFCFFLHWIFFARFFSDEIHKSVFR